MNKKLYLFVLILIIGWIISINIMSKEVISYHDHIIVEYNYANGVKKYNIEYCITKKMQVRWSGEHVETTQSKEYFNVTK